MLQRNEPSQTPPTEAPTVTQSVANEVHGEAESVSHNPDLEFAALTAVIAAGVDRVQGQINKFKRRSYAATAVVLFVVTGLAFAVMRGLAGGTAPSTGSIMWSILITAGLLFVHATILKRSAVRLWRDRRAERERMTAPSLAETTRKLIEMDDVRTVGSLMDILKWMSDETSQPELRHALGHLLPRLTEDEALELGKERHGSLATYIYAWNMPPGRKHFAESGNQHLLGVLHVMAHVGQDVFKLRPPKDMPVSLLSTLGDWAAGKEAGQDPAVQQAAGVCRAAIQKKMSLARSGEQLLRASAPLGSGSETLLRPAAGTRDTDPQELLRPGDSKSPL